VTLLIGFTLVGLRRPARDRSRRVEFADVPREVGIDRRSRPRTWPSSARLGLVEVS
jgi:hypothetical protein